MGKDDEIYEVIDENENIIGKATRKECHEQGIRHRVAAIMIVNDEGKLLFQKRADSGRLDHSAAGHLDEGETYEVAAKRELFEELGIECELEKIDNLVEDFTGPGKHVVHHYDLYVGKHNGPFKTQESEVADVEFRDIDEVHEQFTNNPDLFAGGIHTSLPAFLKWRKNK